MYDRGLTADDTLRTAVGPGPPLGASPVQAPNDVLLAHAPAVRLPDG